MAVVDMGVDSISENRVNIHHPQEEEQAEYPRPWAQIHGISFNPYEKTTSMLSTGVNYANMPKWSGEIPMVVIVNTNLGVTRGCARLREAEFSQSTTTVYDKQQRGQFVWQEGLLFNAVPTAGSPAAEIVSQTAL